MLKGIVALGVVLLFCSSVLSQTNAATTDLSLYGLALAASLDKMEKSWGVGYRNAIVQYTFEITDDLPSQFGEHRVEYLGYQELRDRYKKLREDFNVMQIHPMKIENGKLKIGITVHTFNYKKGSYNYGLHDWSKVFFRFDCEKKEYIVDDVKLGGI
jgi:uncharacterized protein (DUF4213/DUF364 family)